MVHTVVVLGLDLLQPNLETDVVAFLSQGRVVSVNMPIVHTQQAASGGHIEKILVINVRTFFSFFNSMLLSCNI